MAMQIQQEKYQAEYDIHDMGPNNYDLGVGLTYPNDDHLHVMRFGLTREDGQESWIPVFLTELKCIEKRFERDNWEFAGILWSRSLHTMTDDGGSTLRANVKGTYNSRTRTGRLYVLAHEQPKPLVEVLSWDEMCERLNGGTYNLSTFEIKGHPDVVKYLKHDYLISVQRSGEQYICVACSKEKFTFWTESIMSSKPLVLADGRVLFSADGVDCTVYPRSN